MGDVTHAWNALLAWNKRSSAALITHTPNSRIEDDPLSRSEDERLI
jgi:hypothetical protein